MELLASDSQPRRVVPYPRWIHPISWWEKTALPADFILLLVMMSCSYFTITWESLYSTETKAVFWLGLCISKSGVWPQTHLPLIPQKQPSANILKSQDGAAGWVSPASEDSQEAKQAGAGMLMGWKSLSQPRQKGRTPSFCPSAMLYHR